MLRAAAQLLPATTVAFPSSFSSSSSSLPYRPSCAFCPKASHPKDFPPASRIFVRNLSYSTSESSLKSVFSDFGQIVDVKVSRDEHTKKSQGYGFVQYSCQDDAVLAMEHMDRKIIEGRAVFVEIAKPMNNFPGYPITSGPPKKSREAKTVSD